MINKKSTIILLGIIISLLSDTSYSETYEKVISDISRTIVFELHRLKKLENRYIAIMGFTSDVPKNNCKGLSTSISDQLASSIHTYKTLINFHIVARHNLEAIENELLISEGSLSTSIMNYLKRSDILITGNWLKGKHSLNLKVKAFEIFEKGTNELTSVMGTIDIKDLAKFFPDCFTFNKSKSSAPHKKKSTFIRIVDQDSTQITIKVKGEPPPDCNITCKMQKTIKSNRRMAVQYLAKQFKLKSINIDKLKLDKIDYHPDYSATSVYTYKF